MTRKPLTVRGIRAILRKAGVPLTEYKAEVKYGARYPTVGADVYTPNVRRDMPPNVIVEWFDGRFQSAKLPDVARAALDAAGYVTDAHGHVRYKETP